MRILSYNVRSLKQDRHAVLTVLRETDADLPVIVMTDCLPSTA